MLKRSKKIKLMDNKKYELVNPDNLRLLRLYDMDMVNRNLSPKTINVYTLDLKGWFIYILDNQSNQNLLDLTEEEIFDYFYFCRINGNNVKRMKGRMSAISAFYKFLKKKKKLTKENPMEFLDRPRDKDEKVVEQTFLTLDQVKFMIEKLDEHKDLQLKVYALLSLDTMGRVNAISNIRWSQIDWKECTINGVIEKEGKEVDFFFNMQTHDLLQELKLHRTQENIVSEYVFIVKYDGQFKQASVSALWDWSKKIGQMINVPSLHPHDYRHSGAQLLKLSGMPVEEISELLNHDGLDVTRKHYLKQDKKKVREAKQKHNYLNLNNS